MSRFDDIDPGDIDPETNRPYANYSSPSIDTTLHDHEMDVDDPEPDAAEHLRGRCNAIGAGAHPDEIKALVKRAEKFLAPKIEAEHIPGTTNHFRLNKAGQDAVAAARASDPEAQGFTRHVAAVGGEYDLRLLIRPDADLDGTFRAFDRDEGEWLDVNGWLFSIEEDDSDV